jgi:hypothetical protein
MREELREKIIIFNENHKQLVEYLTEKNMFVCGLSSDFKRFNIYEGNGVNDPYNKYVGYANDRCEIDSIVLNR